MKYVLFSYVLRVQNAWGVLTEQRNDVCFVDRKGGRE